MSPGAKLLLIAFGDSADVDHCTGLDPVTYLRHVWPDATETDALRAMRELAHLGFAHQIVDEMGERRLRLAMPGIWAGASA